MISEQLTLEQAATAARAVHELRAAAAKARDWDHTDRHAQDLDDLADKLEHMLLKRPTIIVIRQQA